MHSAAIPEDILAVTYTHRAGLILYVIWMPQLCTSSFSGLGSDEVSMSAFIAISTHLTKASSGSSKQKSQVVVRVEIRAYATELDSARSKKTAARNRRNSYHSGSLT